MTLRLRLEYFALKTSLVWIQVLIVTKVLDNSIYGSLKFLSSCLQNSLRINELLSLLIVMAFSAYFLTFSAPPPLPPIVTDHSRQPPPPQHQEEDKRTPPPLAPIRERYSPQEEAPPAISLRKVSASRNAIVQSTLPLQTLVRLYFMPLKAARTY